MSELCQICGPRKSEAPIVICAPCALSDLGREKEAALSAELLYLRIMRDEFTALRGDYPREVRPEYRSLFARIDRILAIGKNATGPAVATPSCLKCGAPMFDSCLSGCADGAVSRTRGAPGGPRKADSAPPAEEPFFEIDVEP